MPESLKRYGPVIISALVFVALALRNAMEDDAFTLEDRYVLGIAFVNAIVTYIVPNLTGSIASMAKALTNAALVALAFFVKAQTGDGEISMAEWIDGIVLALGAAGVLVTMGPVWNATNTLRTGPAGSTTR